MATVVGFDEMCTTTIVQYHSKVMTASVARRNFLKVGYVPDTSFVDYIIQSLLYICIIVPIILYPFFHH